MSSTMNEFKEKYNQFQDMLSDNSIKTLVVKVEIKVDPLEKAFITSNFIFKDDELKMVNNNKQATIKLI